MLQRNVTLYYLLSGIFAAAFIAGNWIFFWLRYMNYQSLGLVDALAFAFGVVMEVPTGALSDIVGKKWTLVFAMSFISGGVFIMAGGTSATMLILGFLVFQVGYAFYSGAAEAMLYDSLKAQGRAAEFEGIMSRSHSIALIVLVATGLLGGVFYRIHFRLPQYAWGFSFLVGLVVAFFITEPPSEGAHFSLKNYANQLTAGLRELKRPALRPYVPLMFSLVGVYFIYNAGILQPAIATSFGFFADEQAVFFALANLVAALATWKMAWFRGRFGDWHGTLLLNIILGGAFILASRPLGWGGAGIIILINIVGRMSSPWFAVIVNHAIPSESRATTLSTVSLLTRLPYVLTAILAGIMIEKGHLSWLTLGLGVFVLAVTGFSMLKSSQIAWEKAHEVSA